MWCLAGGSTPDTLVDTGPADRVTFHGQYPIARDAMIAAFEPAPALLTQPGMRMTDTINLGAKLENSKDVFPDVVNVFVALEPLAQTPLITCNRDACALRQGATLPYTSRS